MQSMQSKTNTKWIEWYTMPICFILFLHLCAMTIYIWLEFRSRLRTCRGAVAAADGECPCCLPSGLACGSGRRHQLRSHCAHVGHPTVTDGAMLESMLGKKCEVSEAIFFWEMSGEIWRALILTVVAEGNMPRGRRCRKMLGPQMRNDEEWKE